MNGIKKTILFLYLIGMIIFLAVIFDEFSFQEIISLEFLTILKVSLIEITQDNILIKFLAIFFIGILWAFFLGFNSPIGIFSGMIFGSYIGTIISLLGLTLGATLLYISAQYLFRENLNNLFANKYSNIRGKFHKDELVFFILYRIFVGIPFGISNLVAVLFNIKVKNFIIGTMAGILPSVFIWASIGSGFDRIISANQEIPGFAEMITSPEIRTPIMFFLIFLILVYIGKKVINRES